MQRRKSLKSVRDFHAHQNTSGHYKQINQVRHCMAPVPTTIGMNLHNQIGNGKRVTQFVITRNAPDFCDSKLHEIRRRKCPFLRDFHAQNTHRNSWQPPWLRHCEVSGNSLPAKYCNYSRPLWPSAGYVVDFSNESPGKIRFSALL